MDDGGVKHRVCRYRDIDESVAPFFEPLQERKREGGGGGEGGGGRRERGGREEREREGERGRERELDAVMCLILHWFCLLTCYMIVCTMATV